MPEENKPAEEPSLIIDDDWKAQVQKEKELAASGGVADKSAADKEPAMDPAEVTADSENAGGTEIGVDTPDADVTAMGADDPATVSGNADSPPPLPPASFDVHISMLFTQCVAALGQMPMPDGSPGEINKPYAKHFIETVEMLQEKTKGNLSDEESKMLGEVLHAMRMAYVNTKAK